MGTLWSHIWSSFISAQSLGPFSARPKDGNLFLQLSGLELGHIARMILTAKYPFISLKVNVIYFVLQSNISVLESEID